MVWRLGIAEWDRLHEAPERRVIMSDTNLAGLTAIVTGATRGIGRAVVTRLAQAGVNVVLVARSENDLAQVRERLEDAGAQAAAFPCDLADAEAAGELVPRTVAHFGRLDILVNNAGLVYNAPIVDTPTDVFDGIMAVNARAPFILCREAIPHLARSPRASIVNIASVVGHKGYPNQSAYTASKHALMGITKVLAKELHGDGIRVHAICPGGVATELISQVRPDLDPSGLMAPEDIAEVVMFFLTNRTNAMIDEIRLRRASSEPAF